MTAPTGEAPAATEPTTTTPAPVETTPQANPTPAPADPAPASKAPKIEGDFDPQRAASLIEKLRGEVTDFKAAKTAAEKAAEDRIAAVEKRFADQTAALAKALGLVKDDEDQPKPEQVAQQAVAEVQAVQAQLRSLLQAQAVEKAVAAHNADPVALADSRAVQEAIAALDPKASDYADQVSAAVKAASEKNPRLLLAPDPAPATPEPAKQAEPKPPKSGGDIKAGTNTGPITQQQLEAMYTAGQHDEIDKLVREGKLSHLM